MTTTIQVPVILFRRFRVFAVTQVKLRIPAVPDHPAIELDWHEFGETWFDKELGELRTETASFANPFIVGAQTSVEKTIWFRHSAHLDLVVGPHEWELQVWVDDEKLSESPSITRTIRFEVRPDQDTSMRKRRELGGRQFEDFVTSGIA